MCVWNVRMVECAHKAYYIEKSIVIDFDQFRLSLTRRPFAINCTNICEIDSQPLANQQYGQLFSE